MDAALISAIMTTRGRPERAARAVEMFKRQTWPNKELLVIADVRGPGVEDLMRLLRDCGPTVRLMTPPAVGTYVELQNLGLREAQGDVSCRWDDDDLYHPRRLEAQYDKMVADGAGACFFGNYIHLFEDTGKMTWCQYPWGGGLPGTIMCRRAAAPSYPIDPGAETGRDSRLQYDLGKRRVKIATLFAGYLYVYVHHGQNVWDRAHHQMLAERTVSPMYAVDNFATAQKHLEDMCLHVNTADDLL